ncbi:MAG: 3-deoxy-D-manno-octulosonic acid transferase [Verrucomicrobia bacterium]|nr:3-deoxy-D-manno-octulosonic acid transferase [Verrucomicrobiota bacterium]MDE3098714.1 3-deoxy-D-manno-octulosonic acid transferase [Verrucomicrobiota bacterium]
MRTFYNILFTLFLALSSPYYFRRMWRRGNWRAGFGERFARYDVALKQALTNRQVLWLHAVSVGEVNLCTQLIRALEIRLPNIKFVVSTTTTTGMAELNRHLPSHISKIYYPLDRRDYVQRALAVIHPETVVLVEAEIWPNFLWCAQNAKIPVFLANARLSEKSYRGYNRFKLLFGNLFASLAGVGAQNEADAARLLQLGCRPKAVHVVGNLKFDAARLHEQRRLDVPALLQRIGVPPDAPILVGGSTHNGEEAILAEIVHRLQPRFPGLFLVLAPRHFERSTEVGRQLRERGVTFAYRTDVVPGSSHDHGPVDCLLVNTTGELRFFYERATVVFVGKSMTAQGGQNPIEPGALGRPMVFGPHMQNFAGIARSFVAADAAIQAADPDALEKAIAMLLANAPLRSEMGRNALRVVAENTGAIDRTVEMILEQLKTRGVFIAEKK